MRGAAEQGQQHGAFSDAAAAVGGSILQEPYDSHLAQGTDRIVCAHGALVVASFR